MNKLTITIGALFGTTLLMTTLANSVSAQPKNADSYKIHVYKDCNKIDEIPMNSAQIDAYLALNKQELPMKELEQPLKEMERKLDHYEKEMDALDGDLVDATDKSFTVNKAVMKKYEDTARKMELVVKSHQKDIQKLEQQARLVEAAAHEFREAIEPSLEDYSNQDVNISIGPKAKLWQCEA